MDEKSLFTKFWINESKTTAKVLERIPENSDYRPDPNSRTAQDIAWQIVAEEKMIMEALETGNVKWAPGEMLNSMKEVADTYVKQSADLAKRWEALPQEKWDGELDFFGHPCPGSAMAWIFLFDLVHHRGQISTYLRPMGSKVPRIYRHSFDEP